MNLGWESQWVNECFHMSHVTRKPVFGVSDQVRLKPAAQLQKLARVLDVASRGITLYRQWTMKALIRLRGCAGWSAPLLFACGINRFSHDMAHIHSHWLLCLYTLQMISLRRTFSDTLASWRLIYNVIFSVSEISYWLMDRSIADRSVSCDRLINWLIDWLIDWHIFQLTDHGERYVTLVEKPLHHIPYKIQTHTHTHTPTPHKETNLLQGSPLCLRFTELDCIISEPYYNRILL